MWCFFHYISHWQLEICCNDIWPKTFVIMFLVLPIFFRKSNLFVCICQNIIKYGMWWSWCLMVVLVRRTFIVFNKMITRLGASFQNDNHIMTIKRRSARLIGCTLTNYLATGATVCTFKISWMLDMLVSWFYCCTECSPSLIGFGQINCLLIVVEILF